MAPPPPPPPPPLFFLLLALAFIGSVADAAIVEHTFHVDNMTVRRLCKEKVITAVNGRLPGPTIYVHEGDTVIVHVINVSPYNMSIHWHGIFQLMTAWADGPDMVTQCPIRPGKSYTYKFSIVGQEGTLWWHAHVSVHRATVYGALIILPREGPKAYPFPQPYNEVLILLGEWWNANVVDVENEALLTGLQPNKSDAYTINGRLGDLYQCSSKHTYKLDVEYGKTYLLRIINAAVNNQLFFKVAGHSFTIVAADASYTVPYHTDVLVLAPGQTVDALMVANAPPSRYYMAARAYISNLPPLNPFDNTTTTGIVQYKSAMPSSSSARPVMPAMPNHTDTPTAHRFYTALTALVKPGLRTVPLHVDEHMFVTFGLGAVPCRPDQPRCTTRALAASMNNVSFEFPTKMSLLEAHFKGVEGGIYTTDFPDRPPKIFDFTSNESSTDPAFMFTNKGTKLKKVRYNATVEMVLQNTAIVGIENHPLHLHGFSFFVVAQGFGNYDWATAAVKSYDLVHPQVRNTVAVPTGGWAVIRFVANNPGVWFMHCHLDVHLPWGLAMAFEVENGPTPDSTLPPPPPDFPRC